jgi:hypothetical protein
MISEPGGSSIVGGVIGAVGHRSPNNRAPRSKLNGGLPGRPKFKCQAASAPLPRTRTRTSDPVETKLSRNTGGRPHPTKRAPHHLRLRPFRSISRHHFILITQPHSEPHVIPVVAFSYIAGLLQHPPPTPLDYWLQTARLTTFLPRYLLPSLMSVP